MHPGADLVKQVCLAKYDSHSLRASSEGEIAFIRVEPRITSSLSVINVSIDWYRVEVFLVSKSPPGLNWF